MEFAETSLETGQNATVTVKNADCVQHMNRYHVLKIMLKTQSRMLLE